MKITKRINRVANGKKYWKYTLDITPAIIEELGWDGGDGAQLEGTVVGDTLVLSRANES